jgi:hypothetical protein
MDIKDFVENSLIQIVEGVVNANTKLKEMGAKVSSKDIRPLRESTTYNQVTNQVVNLVDFDLALTVSDKDSSGIGGGIKITSFTIGGQSQNESTKQTVSRIKFSIPLTLPQ